MALVQSNKTHNNFMLANTKASKNGKSITVKIAQFN